MSTPSMFFQSFIDIELWNAANWRGVAWMWSADEPPAIGLMFANHDAAIRIFDEWIERLGHEDVNELLRISVIEGPIPGLDPGYSVRIGTNIPKMLEIAESHGHADSKTLMMTASRFHRMNPPPGSSNLANFKREYRRQNEYLLVPVLTDSKASQAVPVWDRAIKKRQLHLRLVEEIAKGDFDSDIFLAQKDRTGGTP